MEQWRRTLYAIWITQVISAAGFSFVVPFFPYYIQELGITDPKAVALWSGLATSAMAVSMALIAPVWGALADRHGRKLMLLRAMFAGAVVLTLMGFVTSVQQLVALRFLQGLFTGTVAAATTLVAGQAPKERAGAALGSLQTAVFLGVSFGPLVGGLSGDAFGYRPSFWMTGTLLAVSGVLVLLFVHEEFHPASDLPTRERGATRRSTLLLLGSGALLAALMARILLRVGTRALDPILPLFVQSLLPAGAHVGTTTGIISGIAALGAAAGSPIIGGWSDRFGRRRLLVLSAIAAGLFYIPQAFAGDPRYLIFWQLLSGFAVGGTLSTLTALLTEVSPAGHEGIVFGLDASAVSAANAIGPVLGAAIAAQFGLRAPFITATVMFGVGALAVLFLMREMREVAAPLVKGATR